MIRPSKATLLAAALPRAVLTGRRPDRAAFLAYLLAVLTLPLRWLSPIGSLYEHAAWTDIFVAAAVALWLLDRATASVLSHLLRRWQLALAGYMFCGAVSAAASSQARSTSWGTVLLMLELAALAIVTADFARDSARRRLIEHAVLIAAAYTVALALVGLLLFYAGVDSGLIGSYGEQFEPSRLYARVQAGFESPPLLASFCIFASGIAASADAGLTPRRRLVAQLGLGLVCAATLSRGLIGFLLAIVLRWSRRLAPGRRQITWAVSAIVSLALIGMLTAGRLHLDPTRPSSVSYTVPDPGNRREAFVTSLETLGGHPLLGLGPGSLPGLNRGSPFRAHFTPLNIAATLGAPALLAMLVMLALIWRDRRRPTDIALWSAAAGIALDGLAQDIDHFRHVWLLLGLLAAAASARDAAARTQARWTDPREASATLDRQTRLPGAGGTRWPA